MEHQRQQAEGFGLVRQQRGDEPAQPDPFLGEVAAAHLGAGGIGPPFGKRRVDGGQHRLETVTKIGALGHAERNAGLPDLALGAHQPLAHGGWRNQEGGGDGGGVEAEDGLQDQRRADDGIDRRVGASEHQRQAIVGNVRLACRRSRELLRHQPQLTGGVRAAAPPPGGIDHLAPRHRDQPCLGAFGHSARRPIGERGREGVGQGVLRSRDIAGSGREEGDELAVAPARQRFGGRAGVILARHC